MSRKRSNNEERLTAELRQIQKAAAVLACIQCAAEYGNEVEADLADAVAAVRELVTAAAGRLDAVISQNGDDGE